MKKILLVGLLLFSTLASAHGYGPPPQYWNGPAYPEGRHHHPPPPYYRDYRYERREFRSPTPTWSCNWSGRHGWGCRIWYADPHYRRW